MENIYPLLIAIIGEIGNNSFNHNIGNWPDIPGVFFSTDLESHQVILADRGQGVLETLKSVKPDLKTDREAVMVAFTEYISARAPEKRGNGLKFVKDVIAKNPINLEFYTGKAKLIQKGKTSTLKTTVTNQSFHGCLAIIDY